MSEVSKIKNVLSLLRGTILFKLFLFVSLQGLGIFITLQHLHFMQVKERNFQEIRLQQQNLVLKETLLRSIDIADNSIDTVKVALGSRYLTEMWEPFERYNFLKGYINNTVPMLMSYSIYDERGDLYANSFTFPFKIVNIQDRQYFKDAKLGMDRLYFGPYYGRVIDKWSYSVIRRVSKPNGDFNGVIVGTMGLHYFAEFCKDINNFDGADTYIISPDNLIIMQCGYNKIVTDNVSKPFFEVTADGQFKGENITKEVNSYYSEKWLLLMSTLPGHSGIRIATLTSRELPVSTAMLWQHKMLYLIIFLLGLICFILHLNALLASKQE